MVRLEYESLRVEKDALVRRERHLHLEYQHPDGPQIHILLTPEDAAAKAADAILDTLSTAPKDSVVLLATGNTMLLLYPVLIARAKGRGIDLSQFHYGHLDNYVYRPDKYPEGSDEHNFTKYLLKNFIEPAGIPPERFHPINGVTNNPEEVARKYQAWLEKQHIAAVVLGLGPVPEVHLGYMNAGTPLNWGVHHVTLSQVTVKRNKTRNEDVPSEAITVGPANLRAAQHKFVLAFAKPKEVRATFNESVTPDVVATMLRTDGFRESVSVFLDLASTPSPNGRNPSASSGLY